jgi:hypothetical protein
LYSARIQNRVQKWLSMLAQSKADRLGLNLVEPLNATHNGANGDGAID